MNRQINTILVTGGAGFIGSALIRHLIQSTPYKVINLDKLTYAGNLESLASVAHNDRYSFEHADICSRESVRAILKQHKPDVVMHLAAESHVDRSIDGPAIFMETNIIGTYTLLEAVREYASSKGDFLLHHISTDEVYGDLEKPNALFTEETPYNPSSPYAASKASSDHLVRAWARTYNLPVIVTNCSNNYGPYHFPEKLIPHMILNALKGKELPVYGDGKQVRDWLYVEDHAEALLRVIQDGKAGETYNIGGHNEMQNLGVIHYICDILEELIPEQRPSSSSHYRDLITFVKDRPGHDRRYAIDASKIQNELGWSPKETFNSGLRKTVQWYLDNEEWWQNVLDGSYRLERIGEGKL